MAIDRVGADFGEVRLGLVLLREPLVADAADDGDERALLAIFRDVLTVDAGDRDRTPFGVFALLSGLRDTIGTMNMVALGRVVLTRREHVIALEPRGRGLLGLTLRYPYEVRDQAAYFEDIPDLKLPKEMLDLASHILTTKSGHFDPSQFEDRYENALVELLKKKEAGEKIEPAKPGPSPRVVNLMEALRASIDGEKKKAPAPSVQARRPAKKKASGK